MMISPTQQQAGRLVRATAALATASALAFAAFVLPQPGAAEEAVWEGNTYLQVPVRFGSDTRLVMPEPFDDAWERESEVACTLMDARTLIIRPRSSTIEQRLTLRGRVSGTLYLARVSSALPYAPLITVSTVAPQSEESRTVRPQNTVLGLLKAMMQGHPPAGYEVQHSQRVLLDQAPYRIVASEVWRSHRQTGIVAHISTVRPSQAIPIVPANIFIRIPELGTLRAMAADDFELAPNRMATHVYLVYTR